MKRADRYTRRVFADDIKRLETSIDKYETRQERHNYKQ